MSFFEKLMQGRKDIEVGAPAAGQVVGIETVPDDTFAQEMLGKGVAILPEDGRFVAPADGVVESLFPTGHAYAVTTPEGAEIMVHIGLDTVKLKGEHFKLIAAQGDTVKKGDPMVEVDLEAVKQAGYEIITPVLVLNPDDFSQIDKKEGHMNAQDAIMVLKR